MAMLKTVTSGTGSVKQIENYINFGHGNTKTHEKNLQDYLNGNGTRAKAFGHSANLPDSQVGWHEVMDATRKRWNKDRPSDSFKRKREKNPDLKWRSYYHFVISPAKEDHVGADEMAEIAETWCRAMWPSEDGYQWIYSVHDDNESGIMHAHVVLNAVNDLDGRKVQISRKLSDKLAQFLQKICREKGIDELEDIQERRERIAKGLEQPTHQKRKVSVAEAAIKARGGSSWVADIREQVDRAAAAASDWGEFLILMEDAGYSVEWTDRGRGIGFRHPKSKGSDLKVMGRRLGADYTEEGLRARIGQVVDAALGTGGEKPRTHEDRARYRSMSGDTEAVAAMGSAGILFDLEVDERDTDIALKRIRMRGGNVDVLIDLRLAGIAAMKRAGIERIEKVEETVAGLRREADEADGQMRGLRAALQSAETTVTAARELTAARSELENLPRGMWSAETRRRRNELEEKVTDTEATLREGLSRAAGTIESLGISGLSETDQAERIRLAVVERVEREERGLRNLQSRIDDLFPAERMVDELLGHKVPETARWNGAPEFVATLGRASRSRVPVTTYTVPGGHRASLFAIARNASRGSQREALEFLAARRVNRPIAQEQVHGERAAWVHR